MRQDNGGFARRQGAGAVLALAALMSGSFATPATASALAAPTSAGYSTAPAAAVVVTETPSERAFRTTSTLAAIVMGTVALVGLWWLLVVRNRTRD